MALFLSGIEEVSYNFAPGDAVFLLPGAVYYSDFDNVFEELFQDFSTRFRIDGTVLCAGFDAVSLSSDGSAADSVIVGTLGQVHAIGGDGVYMNGPGARLINDGQVSGDTGAVIANPIFSTVENRGTLSGNAADGAGLRCENGQSFVQVSNSGTISGASGVSVAGCYVHVVNSGSIRSTDGSGYAIDLTLAFAGCVVRNIGLIESASVAFRDGAGDDLIVNSGQIIGDVLFSGGNDTFNGARGVLEGALYGGIGNDVLASGLADDLVYGGNGNDRLRGNAGDDSLYGGNGSDTLRGDRGDDVLWGGRNADIFVFRRGDGNDRIADFENGIDRIDLRDFALASFAALSAVASNRPAGLLIDLDSFGGDTIMVAGLTKAQFDAGDVIL